MTMSGGGSGGTQTQTTRSEPWSGQEPYLREIFGRAEALSDRPVSYYSGATYAAPSWETQRALGLQRDRALAGSPLSAAASRLVGRTLAGDYVGSGNPYLAAAIGRAADAVRPAFDAQFAGAGRYGSGAHARALAGALAETAGDLAYRDYGQERQNQLAALAAVPELAAEDYRDIARLAEVGTAREDAAQQQIDDAKARFEFAQMEPWERLARYAQLVSGNYGGTTTVTMPGQRRSIGQGLLSGASTGASIGASIAPFSGIGPAIGAFGGGLLGLLGR
jgi:hypothetical protein